MSWSYVEHIRHASGLSLGWAAGRLKKVHVVRNPEVNFVDLGVSAERNISVGNNDAGLS